MPNYIIKKERKKEDEIIRCVEELIERYKKLIQENNAEIKRRFNVFTINAQVKRMMFLNFNLDATLTIEDGKITIAYDTNIPVKYVEQVKKEIHEMLEVSGV